MKENFKKLKDSIDKSLSSKKIVVSDIFVRTEGKIKFLTIELDKLGGMDLDSVVEASNIINPIVDKFDIIDEAYILDIISKKQGGKNYE